jgi:hypothetical protein
VSETLGSLVDKLSIVNCKLYMVQDVMHQAAKEGKGVEADTVKKVTTLNFQRNQLMFEIDVILNESIRDGRANVDPRIKIT